MQSLIAISSPIAINFDLTPICNYRCSFCYTPKAYLREGHPPFKRIKRILSVLCKNKATRISLLGGEPTQYPHLGKLLLWMFPRFTSVTLVTNGSNHSNELFNILKKTNTTLCVSLHGLKDTHERLTGVKGSFSSAIFSIRKARLYEIPILVSFTITRDNFQDLLPLAKRLKKEGIAELVINRFSPAGKSINALEKRLTVREIKLLMKKIDFLNTKLKLKTNISDTIPLCVANKKYCKYIGGCLAGTGFASVDYKGNIKLCPHSVKPLGNILKQSLKSIWTKNPQIIKFRSLNWVPKECKVCPELELCLCGCHLSDVSHTHKPFSPDVYYRLIKNES